jgi:homoserine kinase
MAGPRTPAWRAGNEVLAQVSPSAAPAPARPQELPARRVLLCLLLALFVAAARLCAAPGAALLAAGLLYTNQRVGEPPWSIHLVQVPRSNSLYELHSLHAGGRALGLGRGNEVYPLPEPPAATVLLVHPGLHISTADAYRRLDDTRVAGPALTTDSLGPMISYCCGGALRGSTDRLRNDFEPVIFSAYPELARLQRVLARAGAFPALLSGSGSAMFGIFDSGAAAGVGAGEIRRRWPQWRMWTTRTVSRRRLAASLSTT